MKNYLLFSTGFIQVFFVAINTLFIAQQNYYGVAVASFAISLIWAFNVTKVAFGTTKHKVIYALGAMCGSLSGVLLGSFFN